MGFLLVATILFVFGAVLGSFLNVLIYRTINELDWVKDRSRCDHCQKLIAWYDNIPLLSFVVLKGKCRHCGKKISFSHLVVEVLTGSLFVWWYMVGFVFFRLTQAPFSVLQPLFWLLVGVFFLIILVADIRYYIIPDYAVLPLFVLTVFYRVYLSVAGVMQVKDLILAVVATVVLVAFFFALWFFTKGKGFGFGDVKLAVPLGLLLGWPKTLVGVFFAFILGGLLGIILLLIGKKKFGQVLPFGPFLIAGALIALIYGEIIWAWYITYAGY